jgi:hypothetical protein
MVFWDVMACGVMWVNPEDGDDTFLQNGNHVQPLTVSQPRRP